MELTPTFAIQCYDDIANLPKGEVTKRLPGCETQIRAPSSRVRIMPTVLRDGPYAFVFFSSDRTEPPHIHVKRDANVCKYWLGPIGLAKNRGFPEHELNQIEQLVNKHLTTLLEAWHEYFGP